MDHRKEEGGDIWQTGNDQIDQEFELIMIAARVDCIAAMKAESRLLKSILEYIEDALRYAVVEDHKCVSLVIKRLSDAAEVGKLIQAAPEQSKFYKNASEVSAFVHRLRYWRIKGRISDQNSMVRAYIILSQRLTEDSIFLGNCR